MSEAQARALLDKLTYEEKVMLNEFLKKLESERNEKSRCQM